MPFEDLKEVLGSTASVCQIIQFFSGALVCKKFMKKGSSDDISSFPFICGFLSCALWTGYSKLLDDYILIYINVLGSLLMFAYTCAYYVYSSKKNRVMKLVLGVIFIIVAAQWHVSTLTTTDEKKQHLGILCSFLSLAFFSAPFATLAQVIRQKSAESLPFPLILTSFIVSLQWSLYGYLLRDGYVLYLNLLGFCLSSVQLALFCLYPVRWMRPRQQEVSVLIPEHRIKISS